MSADRDPVQTPQSPALDKAPSRIAGMFNAIAGRYDLLNAVLSAGLDRVWRRRAVAAVALRPGETLLDVCAGTADVCLEAARAVPAGVRVVGVDFAGAMLAKGQEKVRRAGLTARILLVRGDAVALPVPDGSVDALTIAFGIRNVQDTSAACREACRVLRPGGRLAIVEFGLPHFPGLRQLYGWYFLRVLPRVGRIVSRHGAAYSYLPASVGAFPYGSAFVRLLEDAGFGACASRPMTLGVVYLYTAAKPGTGQNEAQEGPRRQV